MLILNFICKFAAESGPLCVAFLESVNHGVSASTVDRIYKPLNSDRPAVRHRASAVRIFT